MTMTKEQFKTQWESDEDGGGISWNDVAACAKNWDLYRNPRIHRMDMVLYAVLKVAGTKDAEEFKPRIEEDEEIKWTDI